MKTQLLGVSFTILGLILSSLGVEPVIQLTENEELSLGSTYRDAWKLSINTENSAGNKRHRLVLAKLTLKHADNSKSEQLPNECVIEQIIFNPENTHSERIEVTNFRSDGRKKGDSINRECSICSLNNIINIGPLIHIGGGSEASAAARLKQEKFSNTVFARKRFLFTNRPIEPRQSLEVIVDLQQISEEEATLKASKAGLKLPQIDSNFWRLDVSQ